MDDRPLDGGTPVFPKLGKLLEGFDFQNNLNMGKLESICDQAFGSGGLLGLQVSLGPLHGRRDCDICFLPSVT